MQHYKHDPANLRNGSAEWFTGEVRMGSSFTSGDDFSDYQGVTVSFEAGARTAWHTHPKGQTICIISGEGRAQLQGEDVEKLLPGDVVWFPAGVKHWHGAAPNSAMTHIAIHSPDENGDVVNWMEPVSDEDYLRGS